MIYLSLGTYTSVINGGRSRKEKKQKRTSKEGYRLQSNVVLIRGAVAILRQKKQTKKQGLLVN